MSPPLRSYAINFAIFVAPFMLHPIGLELILLDNTWLTWPSVLLPFTPSWCLSLSFAAVQFERMYSFASAIRPIPVSFSRHPSKRFTISSKSVFVLLRIAVLNSFAASSRLSFIWLVSFVRYFSRWNSSSTYTIPAILLIPDLIHPPPSAFR